MSGRVVAIYTTPEAGAPMKANEEIAARAGEGLHDDRYATKVGHYSERGGDGREVTLIARESIAAVKNAGIELAEDETRRNLVTEGIALDGLVGHEFRIGAVVLRGIRTCPPCAYLEGVLARPGLKDALEGMGGVRADIITGGVIRVGDGIAVVEG